ncbi:hypothetical protein FIV07_28165 (plasmid) [Mycobacterium sp. THAF192]|nr:hypothetical protein FIV07_28165 [Mycobacterium sp. THAF192]
MPSDWRIANGLSQIELGIRAGISTASVGSFERAEIKWNPATAAKTADVLQMSVEDLHDAWTRARRRPPGSPA